MRKLNLLFVIFTLFFLVFSSIQGLAVELVKDRGPIADIIIESNADKVTLFAADELQKYIEKISGVKLQIKKYTEKNATSSIYLGNVCSNISSGLPPKPRYEGDDKFVLKTKDNNVCVAGCSPRATLFGVYAFLEQLGCRWPVPGEDYEAIPKLKKISWSESEIISEPAIAGRGMVLFGAHNKLDEILELVDWLAKNRFNFLFLCGDKLPTKTLPKIKEAFTARDMELEWGMHWLPKYLPRELFKEHPEYFRMEKGKRTEKLNMCPSSPEAADIIARNSLKEWGELRDFPRLETLHLWPDDLGKGGWCSCEKCKGLTDSDQTLKITNEVAQRLPLGDTTLAHLSYHSTIYPPKNIKPGKNVRLLYAPRERCYKHAMGECVVNRKYLEYLEGQIGTFPNKPEIFEYYHDYILFRNLPMPLHPVIGGDIKAYQKAGSARIASLSFRKFSEWAYGPNYYVLGKCLWRGKGNPKDIEEYCNAVYGPCAKVMKQYFDLLFELCGTVMQLCEYEMGADIRYLPHHQSYAKTHAELLAPLVTSEHLDKIETILKIAIAGSAEPYRTRVKNQLLLWQFTRLEVRTIYRTTLAGHLKNNLSKNTTNAERQYIIDLIKKVFKGLDEGTEILLSAPADLRGPLTRDKGFMRSRSQGFKKPQMLKWMKELEKQQQDNNTPIIGKELRVRLFPYPHQINWQGQVAVNVNQLCLLKPQSSSRVLIKAIEDILNEVEKLCSQKPKVITNCSDKSGYIIEFKEGSSELPGIANKPQGYQIISKPNEQPPKLVLQGYDSAGALYASQTLRQMLQVNNKKQLLIPQVEVIDAPDMEDRGYFLDLRRESKTWGLEGWKRHIDWAAEHRFNVILAVIAHRGIGLIYPSRAFPQYIDTEHPLSKPGVLQEVVEYGRKRAVRIAPTIPHPGNLKKMFQDYPDTMMSVKGRKDWNPMAREICVIQEDRKEIDFSKTKTVEIIHRLIADLIDVTQPDELSVWPSEAPWYTPEETLIQSRVFYEAYLAAVGKKTNKTLRMLTTPRTLNNPEEMFRQLPTTVKIDYYDAMKTYTLRGMQFRQPKAIKVMLDNGFHFSTMPMYGRYFWCSAPIIFANVVRNNTLVSAKQGARGTVVNGGDQPTAFAPNYAAGAEYSWNLNGRGVPEFLQAWARWHKWPKPAQVADFYLHLEKASIALTLASYGEGFLPKPLSNLQERIKQTPSAKREKTFITGLQKAIIEAEAALSQANSIGHKRFKTEVQIILCMSRALLALQQGFMAEDEDPDSAKGFFKTAQKQFENFEQYWSKLQQLNPGTDSDGPMAGYRRDLPDFITSLQ